VVVQFNTLPYLNTLFYQRSAHFNTYSIIISTIMSAQPRRIAQIIRLKSASLQAYKECHAAAWPAVLAQIKDCNISDYSIYLDETSMTLFATMKYHGTDLDADMEKMRANPEVRKWWEMTDSMQESFNQGATGSTGKVPWWKDLEEVFYVE